VYGTRYVVRGTGCEVRGTRCEVRGVRYVVQGTWYEIRGTGYSVCNQDRWAQKNHILSYTYGTGYMGTPPPDGGYGGGCKMYPESRLEDPLAWLVPRLVNLLT